MRDRTLMRTQAEKRDLLMKHLRWRLAAVYVVLACLIVWSFRGHTSGISHQVPTIKRP